MFVQERRAGAAQRGGVAAAVAPRHAITIIKNNKKMNRRRHRHHHHHHQNRNRNHNRIKF